MSSTASHTLSVRAATSADEPELHRLAVLDSAEAPPARPALIAEVGGRAYAAISIREGTVVADPFERTAEIVDVLRLRCAQIGERRGRAIRPRSRLHRMVALSRPARPVRAPRPAPAH